MKKLILLLSTITLSFGLSIAQNSEDHSTHDHASNAKVNNKHHIHRANHRADHLTKQLGLSAEQRQKIHALSVEEAAKVDAFKKTHAEDPSALHKELKTVRTEFKKQMKIILTADQFSKWEKLKKEEKKKVDNTSPDTDELAY
jgi:Spy/CpxP family protein refolding chaperone